METLKFDRKAKCDWCGCSEICAITHYGTTHYNRLICVECCVSINQNDIRSITSGYKPFDLNNSIIRFDLEEEELEEVN